MTAYPLPSTDPRARAKVAFGAFADAPPIFPIDNLWWSVSITV
jgi:hypothetical protein